MLKNPLQVYTNIDVDSPSAQTKLDFLGVVHHQKVLGQNATNHTVSLNNGNLASVQGLVCIPRKNAPGASANVLQSFFGADQFTSIQLRINGVLYPQTPMNLGASAGAMQTAETFSKMTHLAKVVGRGSAFPYDGQIGLG